MPILTEKTPIINHQQLADTAEIDNFYMELISDTGEILEDISSTGKIKPWKKHKLSNVNLQNLYKFARKIEPDIITDSRMQSLEECGNTLLFLQNAEGKRKLKGANFCRIRTCPMCNWRRSLKLFSQVSAITDKVLERKKARFIFVTLTLKNVTAGELIDTINRMNTGFQYITSLNRNFAPAKKIKASLMGYMKAMEVTYNSKTDTYHPHIHCILELKPSYFTHGYIKKADWVELWQKAMKLDYPPSVDVRTIKNSTSKAVAEVAKYPVKLDDILNIADKQQGAVALITLARAIHKRRLITFGGDFAEIKRELALDDVETGDLVHTEVAQENFNPVAQILFKFRADVGCYIC